MSLNEPTPYYPDLQMLSATLAAGTVTVNTKFRKALGALIQPQAGPIVNLSTQLDLGTVTNTSIAQVNMGTYVVSANGSQVAVTLTNASGGTVSSGRSLFVWVTGVM